MMEVGILKNFDSGTYKAGVQLAGSLTTYFDGVSVAKNIPSSALVIGNYVILAIPGGNPGDACVIATWPQGNAGGGSKIQDADGDTSWDVEPTPDGDEVVGKVNNVESFHLHNDGILTLAKQAGARAWRSGNQVIPDNVWTRVDLNATTFDIQSEVDLVNDKIVVKRAGLYLILGCIAYDSAFVVANKRLSVGAKLNGSWICANILHSAVATLIYAMLSPSPALLSASDEIDLWAHHNFGAPAPIIGSVQSDWLAVVKMA
jgi:hypothetical protein